MTPKIIASTIFTCSTSLDMVTGFETALKTNLKKEKLIINLYFPVNMKVLPWYLRHTHIYTYTHNFVAFI